MSTNGNGNGTKAPQSFSVPLRKGSGRSGVEPGEKVWISIPTHDGRTQIDQLVSLAGALDGGKLPSLQVWLSHGFNNLWCAALDRRDAGQQTHFCMLHSDVVPQTLHWLSILMSEMREHDCDVLGTFIDIKDDRGETSTAIEAPESPWLVRKIPKVEAMKTPRTFTRPDLLLNNGLILVDLRKPWVDKVCFAEIAHSIGMISLDGQNLYPNGPDPETGTYPEPVKRIPLCISEDYMFSMKAKEQKHADGSPVKLWVTRAITVDHYGVNKWRFEGLANNVFQPQANPRSTIIEHNKTPLVTQTAPPPPTIQPPATLPPQ